MGYSGHRERSRKGKKREGKGKEEKKKKIKWVLFFSQDDTTPHPCGEPHVKFWRGCDDLRPK